MSHDPRYFDLQIWIDGRSKGFHSWKTPEDVARILGKCAGYANSRDATLTCDIRASPGS